jgi:hypothetical protein
MNLVIDDAVEVKLQTKTQEESRRHLGTSYISILPLSFLTLNRANTSERRQCFVDPNASIASITSTNTDRLDNKHCVWSGAVVLLMLSLGNDL